jgi:hypothetical protein
VFFIRKQKTFINKQHDGELHRRSSNVQRIWLLFETAMAVSSHYFNQYTAALFHAPEPVLSRGTFLVYP